MKKEVENVKKRYEIDQDWSEIKGFWQEKYIVMAFS